MDKKAMYNKTKTNTELPQTMGSNRSTTATEPPRSNGKQPKPLGRKCILLGLNIRPRFCCCLNIKLFSSHEGFLTNAMHHNRDTIKSN